MDSLSATLDDPLTFPAASWTEERKHSAAYLEARMKDLFEGSDVDPAVVYGYAMAIEVLEDVS